MTVASALPVRDGIWQADPGFGVYMHIPFCLHRCHYCDFNTYEGLEALREPYVDALVADIARTEGVGRPATSVFFGGGTPTLLSPQQLGKVIDAVERSFGIAADAEITAEANPETVDEPYLRDLLDVGFNRLSIGIQSLAPGVLERLGRTHSAGTALCALRDARAAGFTDLNADLIYGSPWESQDDWATSLAGVIDAAPDHVSAYSLIVEEGTPLHTLVATGRVPDVDPDIQAERHATAEAALGAAGYDRYEVSNWSKPGRASRHNVLYWSTGDYIGFGAGAHSHVGGRRWWGKKLPRDYIAACSDGTSTIEGDEVLVGDQRAGEALMLGLRLTSGVDVAPFEQRFGADAIASREGEIGSLEAAGLVERIDGKLRLTSGGTMLANEALCRLL
jgi:oxygen-independent coproporphyrinogen-3 oxidase